MITIEDVKIYLNIEDSKPEYDSFIQKCIDYTFADIENYCRQPILLKEQTKFFQIYGNKITFNQFPISNIDEVKVFSPTDYTEIETITDYTLIQPSSLYCLVLNNTSNHNNLLRVIYSCGYSQIPLDVKKVNIEMAALMYKESDTQGGFKGGRLGVTSSSENVNSNNTNFSYKLPIEKWSSILNKYQAPII